MFKEYRPIFLSVALWILVWAGYNTGIERLYSEGFPNNLLDLIHGIRAFSPLLAGCIALGILIGKKKFSLAFLKSPIGLIIIFSLVGIVSSLIFSQDIVRAVYWGLMYLSVLLVVAVFLEDTKSLQAMITMNIFIASAISLLLVAFLFVHLPSISFQTLFCQDRPYEGLGNIFAQADTFGMAGSRPTGLARYAGFSAIAFFTPMIFDQGWVYAAGFFVFLFIVLFSRGKTVMAIFPVSLFFILWIAGKLKRYWLIVAAVFLIAALLIFNKIPCKTSQPIHPVPTQQTATNTNPPAVNPPTPTNSEATITSPVATNPTPSPSPITTPPEKVVQEIPWNDVRALTTLSGRTNGVWKSAGELFLQSPLFGFGFHADRIFLQGEHAHNLLLHMLIQAGLLGTVFFIAGLLLTIIFLVKLLKASEGKQRILLIQLAGLISFIFMRSLTESFAYYSADWLFLAPIIAYIQVLYYTKHNESNHNQRLL